jgi:glutamate synthase (NADPH/NADH) small chain
MTTAMLRFVSVPAVAPMKRDGAARRADFAEIHAAYEPAAAAEQAARCSQCGVPFCQVHCPLSNNIPDWLRLAAEGRLEEAYALSSATNAFPEICGRICPQDRLCEGSCVIERAGHGTVTIGAIERFITDTAFARGWVKPAPPRRELGQSVGIVGAGPAGLTAAGALRRRGYAVAVYDRHDRMGGLLMYGIPNFKLDKAIVERRVKLLQDAGVRFHAGVELGRDLDLAALRSRHDAVLLACGVYRAREMAAPGIGLPGIVPALDYLIASNRRGLGDAGPGLSGTDLDAGGKRVVVIGGGDTAMDCVRTAVRQGAKAVTCLYRRDRANMPGSRREVAHAEEEGVQFAWLAQPEAFLGETRVTGVRVQAVHLGVPDAGGRQTPRLVEGAHSILPAEMVVQALGFLPEDIPGRCGAPDLATPSLTTTGEGRLGVDPRDLMTNIPGVFAAGDVVRGASLVVWAIRDGADAAAGIHAYLASRLADRRQDGRVAAE